MRKREESQNPIERKREWERITGSEVRETILKIWFQVQLLTVCEEEENENETKNEFLLFLA